MSTSNASATVATQRAITLGNAAARAQAAFVRALQDELRRQTCSNDVLALEEQLAEELARLGRMLEAAPERVSH